MADAPFRVLPLLDDLNRAYWTGGLEGELRVLRCGACGYWIHPPSPRCPQCLSTDVAPQPMSGRGTVVTYTVNVQPWNPTMPPRYAIALVEVDEQPGLRITTNVVGCEPDDVHIGMRVQVTFDVQGEVALPMFEPERAA